MLRRLKTRAVQALGRANEPLERRLDSIAELLGAQHAARVRDGEFTSIREAEFRVFSQWGQDGIIQFLLGHVEIENDTFVEIGVDDYVQANTRFLLVHDNWRGLIVDAGERHVHFTTESGLRWSYALEPVSAFVTRENVRELLHEAGVAGDIGLLSLDIDGNDYWVLERALGPVSPRIVIAEYNSTFGKERAVTIPYDEHFRRATAHYSHLYYGASLPALDQLLRGAGYVFAGANSAGNDAFFVRADVASRVPQPTLEEGYVASRFRESLGESGEQTYLSGDARLEAIADLPLVDVLSGSRGTVRELLLSERAAGISAP